MEEIIEVVKLIPQDKVENRTVEHIVAAFVPQIHEDLVDVIRFIPQERISDLVVEQIVDIPDPKIREPSVEVANIIHQEYLQQHTGEQIADVPVPTDNQPGVLIQVLKGEGELARTRFSIFWASSSYMGSHSRREACPRLGSPSTLTLTGARTCLPRTCPLAG